MAKKQSKKTGDSPAEIVDIEHEEVVNKIETPADPAEPEPLALEVVLKKEVARFNLADAGIAKLKEQYGSLQIGGIEDKDGYKAVKDAWKVVQSRRTGLEKKGLEIRTIYSQINKGVIAEENRLIGLLEPLEKELQQKWKAIDEERDRLDKEREAEEQAQLNARIKELLDNGMAFTGGYYAIGPTIALDVATLRAMAEEDYRKFLDAVKAKSGELAEEKRLADEAENRRLEQMREDQRRLDEQKEEMRRSQEQLDRQRQELQDAKDKLELERQEAANEKRKRRIERVEGIGFEFKFLKDELIATFDNGFANAETFHGEQFLDLEDGEFDIFCNRLKLLIISANDKKTEHDKSVEKEKNVLKAKKTFIIQAMSFSGLEFDYLNERWSFENEQATYHCSMEEMLPLTQEEVEKKAKSFLAMVNNSKTVQANAEKARAAHMEKRRLETLSDQAIFNEYLLQLQAVKIPASDSFKSDQYRAKVVNFYNQLSAMIELNMTQSVEEKKEVPA